MNKRNLTSKRIKGSASYVGIMLTAIFFICGTVLGTFTAGSIDASGSSTMYGDIYNYIKLIESGSFERADFISALFSAYEYHLLVIFLGLSIPGFVIVPIVSGVRGFYLSFSIAAFIKVFGFGGTLTAVGLFGLTAIITIPCLFILSAQSFNASYGLWLAVRGRSKMGIAQNYNRGYFLRCAICLAVLFISVIIELYLTPWFVSAVSVFL